MSKYLTGVQLQVNALVTHGLRQLPLPGLVSSGTGCTASVNVRKIGKVCSIIEELQGVMERFGTHMIVACNSVYYNSMLCS